MQLFDSCTYLPDDILQKVDRASMAVSLEMRPRLLDHGIVEFAWSLPRRMLLRGSNTKWLLRRVLDRCVPRALVSVAQKMGFAIPLADWLRRALRDRRGTCSNRAPLAPKRGAGAGRKSRLRWPIARWPRSEFSSASVLGADPRAPSAAAKDSRFTGCGRLSLMSIPPA